MKEKMHAMILITNALTAMAADCPIVAEMELQRALEYVTVMAALKYVTEGEELESQQSNLEAPKDRAEPVEGAILFDFNG